MFPVHPSSRRSRGLVGVLSLTVADALLKENNELLKQLVHEVRKILRELETMNEMTKRRLPYKWIPGESGQVENNE